MDILGPATFSDILIAWALHEFNGRHQRWLPPDVRGLPPDDARREALSVLVQGRFGVILPMLAANIRECLSVRFYPADIPQLFAMGAVPLPTYSQNKLGEPAGPDGSAEHVRGMAASEEPVRGPFVMMSRVVEGPYTIFDGTHRAAAWIAHVNAGRAYPLEPAYLVLTEWPSPAHELPAG